MENFKSARLWITYLIVFQLIFSVVPLAGTLNYASASRCTESTAAKSQEIVGELRSETEWKELLERYNHRYWSKINRSNILAAIASGLYRWMPATLHAGVWGLRVLQLKIIQKGTDPALFSQDVLAIQEFLNKDLRKKIAERRAEIKDLRSRIPQIRQEMNAHHHKIKQGGPDKSDVKDFYELERLEKELRDARESLAEKKKSLEEVESNLKGIKEKYEKKSEVLVAKKQAIRSFLEVGVTADMQIAALKAALTLFPIPALNGSRRWLSRLRQKPLLKKILPDVKFNEQNEVEEGVIIYLPVLKNGVIDTKGTHYHAHGRADIRGQIKTLKGVRKDYLGGWYRKWTGKFGRLFTDKEADYAESKLLITILIRHMKNTTNLTEDQLDLLKVLRTNAEKAKNIKPFIRVRSYLAGRIRNAEVNARVKGWDEAFINSSVSQSSREFLGNDGMSTLTKAAGVSSFTPSGFIKYAKKGILSALAAATVTVMFTYLQTEITDATTATYNWTANGVRSIWLDAKYSDWAYGEKKVVEDYFDKAREEKDFDPHLAFRNYVTENYGDVISAVQSGRSLNAVQRARYKQYSALNAHYLLVNNRVITEAARTEAKKKQIEERDKALEAELDRFQKEVMAAQQMLILIAKTPLQADFINGFRALLKLMQREDPQLTETNQAALVRLAENLSTQLPSLKEFAEMGVSQLSLEQIGTLFSYRLEIEIYRADMQIAGKSLSQRDLDAFIDGLVSEKILEIMMAKIPSAAP